MTSAPKKVLEKPVVLFDDTCRLCVTTTSQMRGLDKDGAIDWRPLSEPGLRERFPRIDWERAKDEMHLIHTDGRVTTGARAVSDIAEMIGGDVGAAAARAMSLPGVRDAADLVYKIVSENRHKIMGTTS